MILPILLAALLCPSSSSVRIAQGTPQETGQEAELRGWIAEGRALLAAGKPGEAEKLFVRAAEGDSNSLHTRLWVLRAWMNLGKSDEVLAALDALEHAGERGVEMSYLYGMAFALRAEAAVAGGNPDSSTGMLFADATPLLRKALEADAVRFGDATLVLARAAWQAQELDDARWAADKSVAAFPDRHEAWLQRGRIALSQFVSAEGEGAASEAANARWEDAASSFRRALELSEAAGDAARAAESATMLVQTLLWRQRVVEATTAFATAIAWAPEALDYPATRRMLAGARNAGDEEGPRGFRAALESGRERFETRAGAEDARLAALDWWLGWARFLDADWDGAKSSFQACLARAPEITNAWFYVALARAYRKDSEGALAALRAGTAASTPAMVAALAAAGGGVRGFENLIGWCATQEPPRNLDAAFLAELLTQAFPEEPRHWNNLGLFLRDEGELLEVTAHRAKLPRPDEALLGDLYDRSFAAYQRALALTPDDPQVLNDTALMLQYHLGRDLDQVEAMYRRSIELSEKRLAEPDLSPDDRERFETTKRDATGNLRLLLEPGEVGTGATSIAKS